MTTLTRKFNAFTLLGNIQSGDVVLGERTDGTTVRLTFNGFLIADGDKGDVTVSASGVTWTIDNDAVTYAKIQNVSATDKLLGRSTAGAGDIEEITLTAAGRALLDDIAASDQRTTLGLGTLSTQNGTFSGTSSGTNTGDQTITLTTDVTGTGTGSFAATIANDAVSYAKMQNVSATDKLLGRSTIGSGDVEEIACTAAGRAILDDVDAPAQRTTLGLGTLATQSGTFSGTSSGTNTGDQTITLTGDVTGSGTGSFAATIANSAVTLAKQADIATASLIYRKTAGTGAPEVNTLATLKTDLLLTGTNSGDQTSIVGITGTKAQFDTAVTDGNLLYVGDAYVPGGTYVAVTDGGTGVSSVTTAPTASAFAGWDAQKNFSAESFIEGYATTATAAGTTILTVDSVRQQYFTGVTTQTVTMPVTSTLVLGQSYRVVNNSTGVVTLQSSGANTVIAMPASTECVITCILTSGTTAASWGYRIQPVNNTTTGTGSLVRATSPTLTTANLVGTTTNDNAAAGSVGEFLSSSFVTVSVTSAVTTNITSLAITAGDWDVWAVYKTVPAGTTVTQTFDFAINAATATLTVPASAATAAIYQNISGSSAGVAFYGQTGIARLSLSGTTTYYLNTNAAFTVSTMSAGGQMYARRRR